MKEMQETEVSFRFSPKQGGMHVHVTVWSRKPSTQTWANCGTIVLYGREWELLRESLLVLANPKMAIRVDEMKAA